MAAPTPIQFCLRVRGRRGGRIHSPVQIRTLCLAEAKLENAREEIRQLKTEIEDLNSTRRDDDGENLTLRRQNAILKEALKEPTQLSLPDQVLQRYSSLEERYNTQTAKTRFMRLTGASRDDSHQLKSGLGLAICIMALNS